MSWHYKSTNQFGGLTLAEIEENAIEIWSQLTQTGWEIAPICAVLGNMQQESGLNPAQMQHGYPVGSTTGGYGLVQWTPASKYYDWCRQNNYSIYDGFWQVYNVNTNVGGQYKAHPTTYPLTYAQFKVDTEHSLDYLVKAWLDNYERNTGESSSSTQKRINYANDWYTFFTGDDPPTPVPPEPSPDPYDPTVVKSGMPVWMMIKYK